VAERKLGDHRADDVVVLEKGLRPSCAVASEDKVQGLFRCERSALPRGSRGSSAWCEGARSLWKTMKCGLFSHDENPSFFVVTEGLLEKTK